MAPKELTEFKSMSMAPKELTEYERKRLENIKRNDEMLASLKVHSTLNQLSAQTKRHRIQTKSHKVNPNKKPKTETSIVIRRSLRSQGMAPDPVEETLTKTRKTQTPTTKSPLEKGPLSMRDVYKSKAPYGKLEQTILIASKKTQFNNGESSIEGISGDSCEYDREMKARVWGSIDLESLRLEPKNVARVSSSRITAMRFFPCADMMMIVVGNKFGDVGFWNVDSNEDGNGIYLYHSHPGSVSGIAIQPFSMSKMFTCCYDGFIRLMDVENETFDLAYSSDDSIFSLSQRPNDMNSLYFGEGHRLLSIWDERTGKCTSSLSLHECKINSIDFNPVNPNMMATSSNDATACIWDLRKIASDKPQSLKMVSHAKTVQSAYFSPSGSLLATTCLDNKVRLLSGANYDELSIISRCNKARKEISPFRGIWGWDDSYIFSGNMERGITVISVADSKNVSTLCNKHIYSIPFLFDAHPYEVGMLAASTSGSQVYLWTSC